MTWQEINNKRLPYIRSGERLFKGMYDDIRRELIASFQNLTTPEEIISFSTSIRIDEIKVRAAYEKFYLRTGMGFAKWIIKSNRLQMERKQEDLWEEKIIEYVRAFCGGNITSVIKTHYSDVERIARKVVEQGINEGWGIDKISRSIRNAQGEIDLWKARRIARTEVVAASNEGVKVGAEDLPGNKEKVWISTFDDRARPDHMAMDSIRVPMNELFTLPSGVRLEYPGDQKVNVPEETINCRCGYEIIVSSEYF